MRTLSSPVRRVSLAAVVALAAIAVSGCLSIKTQTAFQRAPGVVSLGGVICASKYETPGSDCNANNVAERHQIEGDAIDGLGQLLVGFRVPAGAVAPAGFPSAAGNFSFSRREEYAAFLQARFPAPSGQRWEGYISTPTTFDSDASATAMEFHPEFVLPAAADGAPFSGPLPWRMVAGVRPLQSDDQAGTPVVCGLTGNTLCVDTPQYADIPRDLVAPVSDFALLAAPRVTAPQTTTATVAFPLSYLDGGGLGARDVALTATTDMPGATATPSAPSVRMEPGTRSVDVRVPVPLAAPPGAYSVTLTAATGDPAVVRTAKASVVVVGPPDADGDGLADPSDRCPAVARGRFDANGDGCVGPYARISATPSGTWSVDADGVRIGKMRLKRLPPGARVRLRGRVRQTLTATRAKVDLKRLRGKLLARRKGFTATVTAPGFIGQRLELRVKRYGNSTSEFKRIARDPFQRTRRCIPVGATRPAKTCDATPLAGP